MSGKDQVMDQEAARRSEEEWRHCLLPQAYRVLREHGTERPGSSPLNGEKRAGTYHCAGCGAPLFDSVTKFESGTGWPSFFRPVEGAVATTTDRAMPSGPSTPSVTSAWATRTRTYKPGSSWPCGLGSSARSAIWPVLASTLKSENSSLPACA